MIDSKILDRFIGRARGQAMHEGNRYAREGRVGELVGSGSSISTVVRGRTGDFEVALWAQDGAIQHRCTCPSWRNPCKHQIAAALALKRRLGPARGNGKGANGSGIRAVPGGRGAPLPRGDGRSRGARGREGGNGAPEARRIAIEERILAARREGLTVGLDEPPFLSLRSPSGFSYRVQLRGGPDGPHSCECPDFEANRLHTCKHVERVRLWLRSARAGLPPAHRREASRPRVYLHFGEIVEPRLFGCPEGRGAPGVRSAFDPDGTPRRPLTRDERELREWLASFGPVVETQAVAWLEERIARRPQLPPGPFARLLPPLGLAPYPYQWTGAEFLATTGRALLADEMGLGKTVQAILAAVAMRRADRPVRGATIVCPASLRGGWQEEIRRWVGEEATALEGPAAERARVIASRPRWLITHYEQVLRDHPAHASAPPDLLIADEAQRAKGLRTRTARVLKAIGARHVFVLTGTPLENRLEEAYAIAQLVDQRLLPPLWQLDRDHLVRDPGGRRVVLYRGLEALRARLAPAFLRRRKEDVALQLPPRVRSVVTVPMHPAVVPTYEDVLAHVARIAARKVIPPAELERMQRLLLIARRCCNGPHMLGEECDDRKVPKLQELEGALRDLCLGEGRKAVVFSEWTDMTDRVEALCRRLGVPAFHLHGGVAIRTRPALIGTFSTHKGSAVFVSTDAGGVGLNLQAADVVISLDLPWNPARLEQRVARVHRIGSRGTVREILMVTTGSIEERILRLHETKRNVLENIWARTGEDVIAAPGGSGAFQQMVQSLLGAQGIAPVASAAAEVPGREMDAEAKAAAVAAAAAPVGGAVPESAPAGRPDGARKPGPDGEGIAGAVGEPKAAPDGERAAGPGGNGNAELAAALSAVAPLLPQEQRRSLAVVLRALAEALDR